MDRPGWKHAALLATAWALLPALPALLQGQLLGHGLTDLYPSVWGMHWFAGQQPGLPTHCDSLAAPGGMAFYYSSPLHGWLAWPLVPVLGLTKTWNLLTVGARLATVLCAFGAAQAWGLRGVPALLAASIYGAAPFFHGYSVEGLVEGQDGWALACWFWAVGDRKRVLSMVSLGICLWSSWYLGATACVLAVCLGRRGWWSLPGVLLALPGILAFAGAFSGGTPLPDEVRLAMGSGIGGWTPGITEGLQPFAKTSWIGFAAPLLALAAARKNPKALALVLGLWVLSTGWGPWYDLPPLSEMRFPYRFHAGTLAVLAFLAARGAQSQGPWIRWLPWLIPLEGLLLSPVEPVIPGAPADLPEIYEAVEPGVLLEIPGPLAFSPGEENASRPRARWWLYGQTMHGASSPWAPDFNSVGVTNQGAEWLNSVRALDPATKEAPPEALHLPVHIRQVLLHRRGLGTGFERAESLLREDGFRQVQENADQRLYQRP